MARVLHWNGKDLPDELRATPPGTYILEAVDEAPRLTVEEEDGLRQALHEIRTGQVESQDDVRRQVDAVLKRR